MEEPVSSHFLENTVFKTFSQNSWKNQQECDPVKKNKEACNQKLSKTKPHSSPQTSMYITTNILNFHFPKVMYALHRVYDPSAS